MEQKLQLFMNVAVLNKFILTLFRIIKMNKPIIEISEFLIKYNI